MGAAGAAGAATGAAGAAGAVNAAAASHFTFASRLLSRHLVSWDGLGEDKDLDRTDHRARAPRVAEDSRSSKSETLPESCCGLPLKGDDPV